MMGLKYYVKVCLWLYEHMLQTLLVSEKLQIKGKREEKVVCVCEKLCVIESTCEKNGGQPRVNTGCDQTLKV